jgi:hypothetical protein
MHWFLEHDDKEKLAKSKKIEELKNRHKYFHILPFSKQNTLQHFFCGKWILPVEFLMWQLWVCVVSSVVSKKSSRTTTA